MPYRLILTLAVGLLLATTAKADDAKADPLAAALTEKARTVVDALKAKGYGNVGVLKFLIQMKDGPPRDDVGEMNLALANRLRVALILALNPEADKFLVLDRVNETVVEAQLTTANHKDAAGRKAFFVRKYEPSWGTTPVHPESFLTGVLSVPADLKQGKLTLQCFGADGAMHDLPIVVEFNMVPQYLPELGLSYIQPEANRKAVIAGQPLPPKAEQERDILAAVVQPPAAKPQEPDRPFTDSPVQWSVRYNGKPADVVGHILPEPKENDRVEFRLENPTDASYGVVLLVNGENTLGRERTAVSQSRKWLLSPKSSVVVRGFQMDNETVTPFRVLTPEQSENDAVHYGEHAGSFRLVIYHGRMSETEPAVTAKTEPTSDDLRLLAVARTRGLVGSTDGIKPLGLRALQADLRGRSKAKTGSRGLIGADGSTEKFDVKVAWFEPTPETPIADLTLSYFQRTK